jgi:hypothetical protein
MTSLRKSEPSSFGPSANSPGVEEIQRLKNDVKTIEDRMVILRDRLKTTEEHPSVTQDDLVKLKKERDELRRQYARMLAEFRDKWGECFDGP